jgi:G:T/U-mismatch repair DNA glycosylase
MVKEIWEPDLKVLFVGMAADEVSDKLGFHHLHPRDRFWELLEISGLTPKRVITASERKAMAEGQAQGSVSDPIRSMFIEKKTSQLLKLGIGLFDLNRRAVATNDKDKAARPTGEELQQFVARVMQLEPKSLAFVIRPELFVAVFSPDFPGATGILGLQSFKIGKAEVWLLGSTSAVLRGESLKLQEDAFFALGERLTSPQQEEIDR